MFYIYYVVYGVFVWYDNTPNTGEETAAAATAYW